MVKFRIMGTKKDMEEVLLLMSKVQDLSVENVSEPYENYGTRSYYRRYGEINVSNHTGRRKTNEQSNCDY